MEKRDLNNNKIYQNDKNEAIENMSIKDFVNVLWGSQHLLHIAVDTGSVELVKEVIKLGANINSQNSDGETALFNASHNVGIAKILLDAGIDPNIRNNYNNIAIMQSDASDEFIKLLAPICDFEYKDDNYYPFLHKFLWNNSRSLETIEIVLKNSKNKNVLESDESILMREAREPKNKDVIILIAKSGIDLHIRNKDGKDFYDLCFKNVQKLIRKEFPEFMKEKKFHDELRKFNL